MKGSGSIFQYYVYIPVNILSIKLNKRASLACAARLADTLCPPEAPFGRLWSPLINYMGDNISKYVCPTGIIDIARKITKFVNFKNFDA